MPRGARAYPSYGLNVPNGQRVAIDSAYKHAGTLATVTGAQNIERATRWATLFRYHRLTQQVAGGQVTQAVLVLDDRGLPGSTLCMGCRCVLYSLCGHMGCWLEPRTCVPLPLPGGPTRMIFLPGGVSIRRLSSASRSMVATF